MSLVLVKVVRSEDSGDDRNAGVELDPHQSADHRIGELPNLRDERRPALVDES